MNSPELSRYLNAQTLTSAAVVIGVVLLLAAVIVYFRSGWAGLHRNTTKFLYLALQFILGGVFVVYGAAKIYDPAAFASDIGNYRLLPHELINLFAIILPWIELAAGLMLILGIWVRASAAVIAAMAIMFLIAIGQAWARGLDIRCGCLGTVDARRVGLRAMLEDSVYLAIALWLWWHAKEIARWSKTGEKDDRRL